MSPLPPLVSLLHSKLPTWLFFVGLVVSWGLIYQLNSDHQESAAVANVDGEIDAVEIGGDASTLSNPLVLPDGKLVLPDGKVRAARFESMAAGTQTIQHVHTVPGRLRYDQTKHVDIKAPMDGILAELVVTPGDQVDTGDLIAVIRSPEIGQARAEIMRRANERDIARQILNRELTIAKNLQDVSALLDQRQSIEVIEEAFSDRSLGAYRQAILSAYSKMRLSEELIAKVQPLVATGSISGRTVREREGERQLAETAFRMARDEAAFAVRNSTLKAEADVADAERQLNLARKALEALLGYEEDAGLLSQSNEDHLSRLEIRAPFRGSVESQGFAKNERLMRGDSIIVLANTDSLTVEASIRESDWSAVTLQAGTNISVRVPALNDRVFNASIRYFGREVQADTNSVPLIAKIENHEGWLRPGMFVRVTVPVGEPHQALSIKPESVLQHENEQFVFVDMRDGAFQRVDVQTGEATPDWVEVVSGISPGQLIVTGGAFLLKSELLLQGEGE
ncbi:MAG: efflux RND transporter periplasmic adaptor subunit [Rubripirellula sp.]|nr:efflux RND transporter periplasmic adaptor subunit [Rubripirellula sp.]